MLPPYFETMNKSLVFGRMVVDKSHQFFGADDPTVFLVADMWSNEDDDEMCWIDHYRGHLRVSYEELRNTDRFEPLGMLDLSSELSAHDQCAAALEQWKLSKEASGEAEEV